MNVLHLQHDRVADLSFVRASKKGCVSLYCIVHVLHRVYSTTTVPLSVDHPCPFALLVEVVCGGSSLIRWDAMIILPTFPGIPKNRLYSRKVRYILTFRSEQSGHHTSEKEDPVRLSGNVTTFQFFGSLAQVRLLVDVNLKEQAMLYI